MSSDEDPLQRNRWGGLRFATPDRLLAAPLASEELQAALNELAARTWRHSLTGLRPTPSAVAGNASLMTRELHQTLCDHAAGNYRILVSTAAEFLMTAAQREISTLDEKLYLRVFGRPETNTSRCTATAR